jgi:transposase
LHKRQKSQKRQTGAAKAVKDIRQATRKQFLVEKKIRIVLDGLCVEETIAEPLRHKASPRAFTTNGCRSFLRLEKTNL